MPRTWRSAAAIEIARPPQGVWPWLFDDDKLLRWREALKENERVDGGAGPPGAGSRWRQVFEDHGHRTEIELETTEVDAPRHTAFRFATADGMRASGEQHLEPTDAGGTHLRVSIEAQYLKLLPRLMGRIVTRQVQKTMEGDLVRLKQLVESANSGVPAAPAT